MTIYNDLKDKHVLVTGAARGIGYAQVQSFLQQGAKVTGLDLQQSHLKHENYTFVQIDLRDVTALTEFLNQSTFDIVCNTAGILDDFKNIAETSYTEFTDLLKVNLDAMFIITKQLVDKKQPIVFVNMSSYAGLFASGGGVSYTTSKHAINGLTKEIAFEYGKFGVRANAIAPCLVKTEMAQADFETGLNVKLAQETVFNRYAEPAEIADLTLFLASDSSKYITGQIINIDGGYSLGKSIEL
ncbi:3-ketoacyl-(acyl-carrier-protein) reductase [Lapidilactobacillus dextrinicus DSM 20335]|uniref:3-ketoacyl-(Acyl-carrier-protein) reductase n=1 Tax=Lapidilactobacillus dextrinicus DSM 20335 TaxID=1423738 RepID=A0A0R2BMT9_9LACO|nr:SDR family oxidoreductase [Lapidilactobacillus dextrinicus]KRM79890.1 3-ketoacyl-(acyl-carrier-protein) reductase [Lapidilactobacillus dextrinicus DSM 20335]QFG46327.1 SDR family oxidoreductase [Lapidilactobacillus dextrinicus]